VIEQVRYQVSGVQRQSEAIEEVQAMAGWRVYSTNAPQTRLTFEQAVLEYRNEYRVQRDFGRFKGDRLVIAPIGINLRQMAWPRSPSRSRMFHTTHPKIRRMDHEEILHIC